MKNLKIFFLAAVAVVVGLFTACSDEDFAAGPLADGAQVYFPESIPSEFSIGDEVTSIAIPVNRIVSDEAQTVAILADDQSGLFTVPSAVSFAAGQSEAELVVTFDRTALEDGAEYPLALLINDEENTTPYGNSQLNITIVPWPWEYLGVGMYRDDWMITGFGGDAIEFEVNMYEHKTKKGLYMLEELFGWTYMTEGFEATQAELSGQFSYTPTNIVIDATDPEAVIIEDQWSGIYEGIQGYGEMWIATQEPGKMENKVITFPVKGLLMGMMPSDSWYYANNDGLFRVMLPGAEIVDYTLAVEYDSMRVEADGETASAVINFTYGADVTGVKYVVVAGSVSGAQAAQYAAAIADNSAEDINEIQVDGSGSATEKFVLDESGAYSVVAVAYDKAGQPRTGDYAAATFYFPGMGGAAAPDCEFSAKLLPMSEVFPSLSSIYPDTSSLGFVFEGSEIASVQYACYRTQYVESVLAEGGTLAELVEDEESDEDVVAELASSGIYEDGFVSLASGTSFTLIAKATNVYSKSVVVSSTCSTASIDFKGDLVIGDYSMHYDAAATDGGTIPLDNDFSVVPQEEDSINDFFVSNFAYGAEIGATINWYAAYDSTASTMTLSGVWKGNETKGSFLGGWVGVTATRAILFFSYDPNDEAPTGKTPVEIVVDPTTKQLKGLNTNIEIMVGTINGNKVENGQLVALFFADGTTITPKSAGASVAGSFLTSRNFDVPAVAKVPYRSYAADKVVNTYVLSSNCEKILNAGIHTEPKLRTLSVSPVKCEPSVKEFGARGEFKIRENLRVK
ncbi:MAG: hypothetical protein K2K30_04235 [Alistipes sp.]|nr:hypothetical protein [Alistipes sp.]